MNATGITEHPLRQRLAAELHARPPIALDGPTWVSHLAFLHAGDSAADDEAHLHALCKRLGAQVCPVADGGHWLLEAEGLRVKWERHTEFSGYTILRPIQPGDAANSTALDRIPADWVAAIPGQLLAATHVEFRRIAERPLQPLLVAMENRDDAGVASNIAGGAAWVSTDFRLHEGFTRFVVLDGGLTRRQAGRTVQRLVEIETYRMMALLAFPVAREVSPLLARAENGLAGLMERIGSAGSPEDERAVLAELTALAAEVERSIARTAYRFGAAAAYFRLVQQRIDDLRETRLPGFPTVREFMARRLTPALDTCTSVARRQEDLSGRIARNSQLLRTRVDIELERQNQEVLAQMNRRARLQLRLQETVEGLSVVAITYYASQIVHYLAKGLKPLAPWLSAEVVTALAIPPIALAVALGLRRMRRRLAAEEHAGGAPAPPADH
jgi:uncharacterized membrane-anchored protein